MISSSRVGGSSTCADEQAVHNAHDRRPLRQLLAISMVCVSVMLSACATRGVDPAAAPKVESLPELMHRAEAAATAGDKEKARETYRAAAKVDATSKAPWLKLAESYFEAADYGNAVLAAQEVLHRDNTDTAAAGILAVSGLRVSMPALAVLRQQNHINAGTRGEAETLAKSLRELLGEQVLVPRPEPVATTTRPRPRPAVATSGTGSAAAAAAPTTSTPAAKPAAAPAAKPAATASRGNPFDQLK